jgi:NADH:ubiquinone oxidoreductase subunit E
MTDRTPSDARPQIPPERLRAAREALDALPRRKDQLLPALQAAQHEIGWLPREAITFVHEHTRVPLSEVYATATAYSELRLVPAVRGRWHVCTGVACDLAGSAALLDALPDGRTAPIDCQFLCALAPVVADEHERLYGRVTPEALRERAGAGEAVAR